MSPVCPAFAGMRGFFRIQRACPEALPLDSGKGAVRYLKQQRSTSIKYPFLTMAVKAGIHTDHEMVIPCFRTLLQEGGRLLLLQRKDETGRREDSVNLFTDPS